METETQNVLAGHEDGEGNESLKRGYNPLVAVVAAICIALTMASIGYFGFKRPPRNYQGASSISTSNSSSQSSKSSTVTSSDIQKTVDTMDSSFDQFDDNKDFSPTDLSDSSLGL